MLFLEDPSKIGRDMKLVTTGKRKNYLVSESNYHATIFFWESITNRNKIKHRYLSINLSTYVYQD